MRTAIHLLGILACFWMAFLFFSEIGGYQDVAGTEAYLVGLTPSGATTLALDDASGYDASGTIEAGSEVLRFTSISGNTLTLGTPTEETHQDGERVDQVTAPVFALAQYLGWVWVVMALVLMIGLVLAMRDDFLAPIADDGG